MRSREDRSVHSELGHISNTRSQDSRLSCRLQWLSGSQACECQCGLTGRCGASPAWLGPLSKSQLPGRPGSRVPFSLSTCFPLFGLVYHERVFLEALFPSQTVGARCSFCVSSPAKRPAWRRGRSPRDPEEQCLLCSTLTAFLPGPQRAGIPALDSRGGWRFWDPWVLRCSSK